MALTIEEIQENITNGGDVRQIINQIADYVQANPGGGGEDSGLLEYHAKLEASGTDDPTVVSELNGLGGNEITWEHTTTGVYNGTRDGGFPEGRTLVFAQSGGDPFQLHAKHRMPEDDIQLECYDNDWAATNGLQPVSVRIVILPE